MPSKPGVNDGLPAGQWINGKGGIARWRADPDPAPLIALQERTILDILLASKKRERVALDELLRILRRKNHSKNTQKVA